MGAAAGGLHRTIPVSATSAEAFGIRLTRTRQLLDGRTPAGKPSTTQLAKRAQRTALAELRDRHRHEFDQLVVEYRACLERGITDA